MDETTGGGDQGKPIEGDAILDHLAKRVADSGGRLFKFHNTDSPANSIVHDHSQGVQPYANRLRA